MKVKSISFLFLLATVFFSCSTETETPQKVATRFLQAMENRNYEEAMSYSTRSTQKLLTQLKRLEELTGENDAVKPNKVTIVSEDIQGDKAIVYFKEEGNELQQRISLKRVVEENKKVWKVDLLKEELQLNRDAGLESLPESSDNNKMPV
ncbi:MAG: hypothetical protein RL516_628 [Bacteroidota bacterium]|jgi:hypothetical protein